VLTLSWGGAWRWIGGRRTGGGELGGRRCSGVQGGKARLVDAQGEARNRRPPFIGAGKAVTRPSSEL
jgi:hypothetical protein